MNLENFALLMCNGVPPSRERLRKLLPNPTKIVCADGGANKARSIGLEPDLIVGDLDSLEQSDGGFVNAEIVSIPSQDNTDFEKTLDLLLERGLTHLLIASFSGGRIDQTLANVQIAYEYSKRCNPVLADDEYLIIPVTDRLRERVRQGELVSLLPMEDNTVVSTKGLAYELKRTNIPKGGHGISNRAVAEEIEIEVHHGGVLVFVKDI
ncbi:MAG: thiamine diphosphokinase [Bacteroidetes bacterium]|nr:thiamine diphosphokinase [Bacteroidota bacterium]